ncbi:hypothetical protein [Tortoise microvirus 4]|nr:hypothetical protein [Tortoise microvirus 4]
MVFFCYCAILCYRLIFKEFFMAKINFNSAMFETKIDAEAYLGYMLHLDQLSSSSFLGFYYYYDNQTYDTVQFRIVRRSSRGKASPLYWFILVEPECRYRHPATHYLSEDECDRLLEITAS